MEKDHAGAMPGEVDSCTGSFPERLRRLRESCHMKRSILADRCGISRNMIGRYEYGETKPTADVLENLADVFDTSTDYLLGRTNYPGRIL